MKSDSLNKILEIFRQGLHFLENLPPIANWSKTNTSMTHSRFPRLQNTRVLSNLCILHFTISDTKLVKILADGCRRFCRGRHWLLFCWIIKYLSLLATKSAFSRWETFLRQFQSIVALEKKISEPYVWGRFSVITRNHMSSPFYIFKIFYSNKQLFT